MTTAQKIGGKKVLWTAQPSLLLEGPPVLGVRKITLPGAIFTALGMGELEPWLRANPWAASLPLVSWHEHDGPAWAASLAAWDRARGSVQDFQEPGSGFWRVSGAPVTVRRRQNVPRIDAVIYSARDVAAAFKGCIVWEAGAERTGGLLALGAALCHGRAVAVSRYTSSALAIAAAAKHGVEVVTVEQGREAREGAGFLLP